MNYKKAMLLCASTVIAGSIMAGCGLFSKANGFILYGEQQQVDEAILKEANQLKEKDAYTIKVAEDKGDKIVILDHTTANKLVKKGLIKEVRTEEKVEALKALPSVEKGKGILFAKQTLSEVQIDGQPMAVEYKGNTIIGDGRRYGEMFLILEDTDWKDIKGDEKTMAILKYKKDPSKRLKGLTETEIEKAQLVKIGD
ncbi:lipoprotein BA_5634 family protein [Paenibacillus sp. L3-i20]|uniref:lipoprotein BA_5634 family protein n=1 Tax=Paenibacillus sp. L3-i20 TaxID=2905833 RepID=UPI001EDFD1AE|nr:lipoprotein BA_5634 family protein [Paenibacillus sp. L3-i20]GKU77010.1 hypothetical protein L3i20_v214070 [Paenibacillus sp. L3-i20]